MGFKDIYGTNEELRSQGVWLSMYDFEIKLAYAGTGNKEFEEALEKYANRYSKFINSNVARKSPQGKKMQEAMEQALLTIYATCVIKDWRDLRYRATDEECITFSPEKAMELMAESEDFWIEIQELSKDRSNFQDLDDAEDLEASEKN